MFALQKVDSPKFKFYYMLVDAMEKHYFLSESFIQLNKLILYKDNYLDLSTWKCSEKDTNKLLHHPDFEFYREYIKQDTN